MRTVLAAVLAITLFGVPLGYAVAQSFLGDEQSEAERIAEVAAISVAAHLARSEPVGALPGAQGDIVLGLYSPDGARPARQGPRQDDRDGEAGQGRVTTDDGDHGQLVVAVPVTDGT